MNSLPGLTQNLRELAGRHGIRLILQFGSTVSGISHEKSDLDLAVLLRLPHISFSKFSEIHSSLQMLFPDREIDLAIINRADPLFLKKITESCRLLFGERRDLQHLKIYAFRRYQDHRRFLEMERRFAERFIQEVNAGS